MSQLTIFEGVEAMAKRRRQSSKVKHMQSKMKSCAAQWRRSSKKGSYRAHMKRCLRGRK